MNPIQHLLGMPRRAASAARLVVLATGLSAAWSAHAGNCTDAPASGRSYYIVNKASGLQLDVAHVSTKPGADVIQWTGGTQANQQWQFTQTSPGVFTIRAAHSKQALDLLNWDTRENAPVKQFTYTGWGNQQWTVARSGDAYTIASKLSNKLLTMPNTTVGSAVRHNADQQGSPLQRWYFNPVDGKCSTSGTFGSFMGFDRILIGGLIDHRDPNDKNSTNVTDTLNKAPWDLRYQYVNSPRNAPEAACFTKCSKACSGWWGCERMSSDGLWNLEPGTKITDTNKWNATALKFSDGTPHTLIQQWTVYLAEDMGKTQGKLHKQWGIGDGKPEYRASLTNSWLLKAYLDDYRFLLQKIGNSKNIIEIEPDFWGFVRDSHGDIQNDASKIPAALSATGVPECKGFADNAGGLARCLISMKKTYAPNSTIGLHLSCWDINEPDSADGKRGPQACIRYYKSLGAGEGDFLVSDVKDRDAAWAALPRNGANPWYKWSDADFDQFLAKVKMLTEAIGKPMILWQIPIGNENMPNIYGPPDANGNLTAGRWKDDKVKHFFTNIDKVAAAHIVALQFGAGHNEQTSTETDGGYLLWYAQDYYRRINAPGSQYGKLR